MGSDRFFCDIIFREITAIITFMDDTRSETMNKSNKIKDIKLLAATKFLSLYEMKYINKIGNVKSWTVASRKNLSKLKAQHFDGMEAAVDAVVICAVHEREQKLVLIKQFRVPVNDYIYELPAGLIDEDEDMYTALKRELKEETGFCLEKVDDRRKITPVYASGGMTDESMAIIFCSCSGEATNEYLEEDEDLEVVMVSQEEASKLLEEGVKMDAKAYLALEMFSAIGVKILKSL